MEHGQFSTCNKGHTVRRASAISNPSTLDLQRLPARHTLSLPTHLPARPHPTRPPVGLNAMAQGMTLPSISGYQLITMRTIMSRLATDSSGRSAVASAPAVMESNAARSATSCAAAAACGSAAAAAARAAGGLHASEATAAAAALAAAAAEMGRCCCDAGAAAAAPACRCCCCCAVATRRLLAGTLLLLLLLLPDARQAVVREESAWPASRSCMVCVAGAATVGHLCRVTETMQWTGDRDARHQQLVSSHLHLAGRDPSRFGHGRPDRPLHHRLICQQRPKTGPHCPHC